MPRVDKNKFFLWFLYLYIVAFALVAYSHRNHEFFYYSIVYLFLLVVVRLFQKRYKFGLQLPGTLLLGFAVFAALHMAGGMVYIRGIRLYDLRILAIHYDNIVHALGSFLITIASFNLIFPYFDKRIFSKRLYLLIVLLLISLGVGSLNENLEFSAFVFLKAEGVGGYVNNALDLVFNLVGAVAGCIVVVVVLLKKKLSSPR